MLPSQSVSEKPDARQLLAALTRQSGDGKLRRFEEPHRDVRADLAMGILVVPLSDQSPDIAGAFTALTKDVSSTGIGIVTNRAVPTAEALLRLSGDGEPRLLRGAVRGRRELGQGWFRFDLEVTGVVDKSEYPQLKHFVGAIMS